MSLRRTQRRGTRRQRVFACVKHGILVALSTLLVQTSAAAASPAASSSVPEAAVKAAVLYKVARFVEWPAASFANARASIVLCVVGRQASLPTFESLAGKEIGSHPVDVRLVTGDMLDLRQCHIAFFPSGSGADVDYALSKLQGMPVLTVGETENFAARGGVLALVTRNQRVRFTINRAASRDSQLTISSQLLNLATVIDGRAQ